MKKKSIIISFISLILLVAIGSLLNNNLLGKKNVNNVNEQKAEIASDNIESQKESELVLYEVDYSPVNNITELEDLSKLIVRAQYKGKRKIIDFKQDGHIVDTESKSYVDVKEIFKGQESKKTISVFEPAYQKNGRYISMEGYKLMDKGEEYILFLRDSGVGDTYTIIGMHEGKYNLNLSIDKEQLKNMSSDDKLKNPQVEYMGNNIEQFIKLKNEVKNKYKVRE